MVDLFFILSLQDKTKYMKVKIKEFVETTKELDLEYPFYLYFQDELGYDEVCKVFEDYEILVKYGIFGTKIETRKYHNYTEHQILNNLTTEEHFVEMYMEVIQEFKEKVGLK